MSNDLVPAQSGGFLAQSDDDFLARLSNVVDNMKGSGGSHAFLKFDGKRGVYSYGADDVELQPGTQLVLDYRSLRQGWIIWLNGNVADEIMVDPMTTAIPTIRELPDHGPYGKDDGPREQQTVMLKMIEDPFVELKFQANNKSKMYALGGVMKDFIKSYKMHPGCYPIIDIDSNSFEGKDKETGRKYKQFAPKFKIVSWMSADELNAMSEGNPEDYDQAEENQVEEEVQALPEPEPTPAPQQQQTRPAPARTAAPRTTAPRPTPATAPQNAPQSSAAPSTAAAPPARRSRF